MSTEDTNKVVVTLNKGVDVDSFIEEMNTQGNISPYVPSRSVEIYNLKEDSLRNVDFVMTRNEMEELRKDPRVLSCRWGTKKENGIEVGHSTLDTSRLYTRTNSFTTGNVDMGWGVVQTNNTTNQYTSGTSVNYQWPYTLTGKGVDFIIQDSGLQVDHPEFEDAYTGLSRVQQINWFSATGIPGTMPVNFYTDIDGHGTNVCGIAAGKTYGWAKESDIYVMNILGLNSNSTVPISQSFNLVRTWHSQKSVTSTGYVRPTVMNMSWGYRISLGFVVGGNYRGSGWSGSAPQNSYGVINNGGGTMPIIVDSVQADIEDCLDEGVILISAAGNNSYKIDAPSGLDYNNYVLLSGEGATPYYYMRGATPQASTRVVKVGAVALQTSPERKTFFSCAGLGVPFYTAGDYVVGPCSNVEDLSPDYPVATYPFDSNYKVTKVSGTSQASPTVAGLVCCLLQSRPWYDIDRIVNYFSDNATPNRLQNPGSDTSYTDFESLLGGPNKYLYNPFTGTEPTVTENLNATIHGKL
jgi:hypothetical protein